MAATELQHGTALKRLTSYEPESVTLDAGGLPVFRMMSGLFAIRCAKVVEEFCVSPMSPKTPMTCRSCLPVAGSVLNFSSELLHRSQASVTSGDRVRIHSLQHSQPP